MQPRKVLLSVTCRVVPFGVSRVVVASSLVSCEPQYVADLVDGLIRLMNSDYSGPVRCSVALVVCW